ncbi:MAG: peptidylprolyl isomerase [Chitinophagia bacterium]|nr:peptidylprolyl isomerase [Chitinophagia bacterium]
MSIIQRIRDKGAWIMFAIIALALIAFILQDGVRQGGGLFTNTTVLGEVNGTKIERVDFDQKLNDLEKLAAGQEGPREELMGQLWNQEVEQLLLKEQYDKLGLMVSPKELADILFGSNSPLKQEFTDPTTGLFRENDARQAIAQMKKSKNSENTRMVNTVYINPTIEKALRIKYQSLLLQSSYIPKWLLEKQQADNNSIANISYVYYPYVAQADSSVKVSDDDIAAYVKKHENEYQKQEETRNITYVSFSAAPSSTDSANVFNELMSLKDTFTNAKDMEAFFAKNSTSLPFYNSYFSKNRIQQPNKDTLVRIPVGNIYGPYLDGNNYVLAKMIGTKVWPDSAKVRHILIAYNDSKTGQPIRNDSMAMKLADSIQNAVITGADFNALCARYSDDPGSKEKGGVIDFFPQGQMVVSFNDFAFDKPVGTRGVVKSEFGYHFMEVLGQKNPNPAYKIAYLAKPILAGSETEAAAATAAAQFIAGAKNAKQFSEQATKSNKQLLGVSELKQNDYNVGTLGQSRTLVRWIYQNNVGDISEPTVIGDQVIVAMINGIFKKGTMSVAEARPLVENIVRNEKKAASIVTTKFKGSTLAEFANSTGSPIQKADSLSFTAPFISGIGSEPKVVGAAFNKSLVGKTSTPIKGLTGVFAIQADAVGAKASMQDQAAFKQSLMQMLRSGTFRSLESLRKAATIKDYRFQFN